MRHACGLPRRQWGKTWAYAYADRPHSSSLAAHARRGGCAAADARRRAARARAAAARRRDLGRWPHGGAPGGGVRGREPGRVRAPRGAGDAGGVAAQDLRPARPRHRPRRRARERLAVPSPHRDAKRRVLLDVGHRRRVRDTGHRRADRARRGAAAEVARGRAHRRGDCDRGGDVPRRDARDPPRAASRPAPRPPACERELLLRAHGRIGGRVLRRGAAAHVPDPGAGARRSSGWWRSRSRSSSASRGCTAACITRPTSPRASWWGSARSRSRSRRPGRRRPPRRAAPGTHEHRRSHRARGQERRRRPARAAPHARAARRARPAVGGGAEEPQGAEAGEAAPAHGRRPLLHLGRRRDGAAVHRRAPGHGGDGGDRPQRDREPARLEPGDPQATSMGRSRSGCTAGCGGSTSRR